MRVVYKQSPVSMVTDYAGSVAVFLPIITHMQRAILFSRLVLKGGVIHVVLYMYIVHVVHVHKKCIIYM